MPDRRLFAGLLAAVLCLMTGPIGAQGAADPVDPPAQPIEGEPIDDGFVIIDGHYLARPYRVGVLGERITINGRVVGNDTLFYTRRSGWQDPRGRGDGDRRRGDDQAGQPSSGDNAAASGAPRRDNERRSGGYGRYSFPMEAIVEHRLREGNLLIIVSDHGAAALPGTLLPMYIEIMSGRDDPSVKVGQLLSLSDRPVHSAIWRAIVDDYRPEPALLTEAERVRQELDRLQAEREAFTEQAEGGPVMHWLTPMLAAGAVLVAIGVLIRTHRATLALPDEFRGWRHVDPTGVRTRAVVQLVAVLLLLNGLDLLFTILAQRTGQFVELSPVGDRLITNPIALGFYKTTLVALGVGILLLLRQRRAAEVTAWWLCALYVLVLVRWAAVNSLLVA